MQDHESQSPPDQVDPNVWITVSFAQPILTRDRLDWGREDYIRQELERSGDTKRDSIGTYPVLLDLSRIELIGFDVLPRLGALLKYRVENGLATKIVLPSVPGRPDRPNPVIDYLQTWHFGQFVERLTGKPFSSLLDDASRANWHAWTLERSVYAKSVQDPEDEQLVQMSSHRYVRLTRMREEDVNLVESTTDPSDRRYRAGEAIEHALTAWTRGLLRSIFDKKVVDRYGKPAGDVVGTTILGELLINSLIHSHAHLIYTYGQFSRLRESSDGREYFVLSVWDNAGDNGELGKNLWGAVSAERAESPAFGKIVEEYHIWGERGYERSVPIFADTRAKDIVRARVDTPFGSTVAGLTSEPGSPGVRPKYLLDVDRLPDDFQGYSGLGLHRVKLAALVAIDGKMEYAGSTLRTSIRSMTDEDWHKAPGANRASQSTTVEQYRVDRRSIDKARNWPLSGNLWTVWLPVRRTEFVDAGQ